MKTEDITSSERAGIATTFLIGLAGGLVATVVKTLCEVISPPRAPGVPSPLGNAIDAVAMGLTGHPLPEATMKVAEPVVHFIFGMGAGGVYALLVRKMPRISAGYGTAFGFAFWVLLHEIGLPLMGFSPSPAQMTLWEQGNELISHLFFGATLEMVRRFSLRKWA